MSNTNVPVSCNTCAHFSIGTGMPTCAAFPNGIPLDLFNHVRPYPGDHGIRYTPSPAAVKFYRTLSELEAKLP